MVVSALIDLGLSFFHIRPLLRNISKRGGGLGRRNEGVSIAYPEASTSATEGPRSVVAKSHVFAFS